MSRYYLECMICGEIYVPGEVEYVCPEHGNHGTLDVVYDYDHLSHSVTRSGLEGESMWRYRALLPVLPHPALPPLRIGWTPLLAVPALAVEAGVATLWIKDETGQPTGSLKDRASAMAVVKAGETGARVITTASTGNAAAALAGVAASVGGDSVIFVPATAPEAKVAQLLAYGSRVLLVDGSYDQAVDLCLEVGRRRGWYNRTTGYNPYMTEGKKTVAYEIAEQLGWEVPDAIVVPVGDGCIIGAVYKGFYDLREMGWLESMPRLIGVQAEGSAYLAEAWRNGENMLSKPAIEAVTVADSIAAGLPRDRFKAMRAVTGSDGVFVTVADNEILAAIPAVAARSGVFLEPAAAAAWAGLLRAHETGVVGPRDRVVMLGTGNGLKDIPAAMRAVTEAGISPLRVPAEVDAVERAVGELVSS